MDTLINTANMNTAHKEGKNGNGKFNCYCTTLFTLGKTDDLYWVDCPEITDFIRDNTFEVDDVKEGDILVMYNDDCWDTYYEQQEEDGLIIIHTAVYRGRDLVS